MLNKLKIKNNHDLSRSHVYTINTSSLLITVNQTLLEELFENNPPPKSIIVELAHNRRTANFQLILYKLKIIVTFDRPNSKLHYR